MKLASLKSGRDGRLVVVNKVMNRYVSVTRNSTDFAKCIWITGATCGPQFAKNLSST